MAIDLLTKPLLSVELFKGLKPLQITEIARRAERIVYRPGDKIIEEGTSGEAAILIVSGDALRVSGPGLSGGAERLPTGALLGEMAMLIETEHTSTVVAKTSVRALRITRSDLHAQMAGDADLIEHFVKRISARLSKLADQLRGVEATLARSTAMAVGGQAQVYH